MNHMKAACLPCQLCSFYVLLGLAEACLLLSCAAQRDTVAWHMLLQETNTYSILNMADNVPTNTLSTDASWFLLLLGCRLTG